MYYAETSFYADSLHNMGPSRSGLNDQNKKFSCIISERKIIKNTCNMQQEIQQLFRIGEVTTQNIALDLVYVGYEACLIDEGRKI